MLYTRKGDNGTTKTFGCDQRISKSSTIAEALGALDETNSFLGICKVKAKEKKLLIYKNVAADQIVHDIQKNLFIIQAELAGASMSIDEEKVKELEKIIDSIEKELPPIKTFFISGGTELASVFDIARTISRRAERRVIAVSDSYSAEALKDKEDKIEIKASTKAYLNRLSSVLYAFARLANYREGITEESPDYK
ncbi:MAG: cob(I)yrinic acid a,c-diamide adenosyltransferase [Candidatus Paceibacterota bacterium]